MRGVIARWQTLRGELTEDSVQIPESLARYIDYNAMSYDMEVGGDIFTIEVGFEEVHIFWSH